MAMEVHDRFGTNQTLGRYVTWQRRQSAHEWHGQLLILPEVKASALPLSKNNTTDTRHGQLVVRYPALIGSCRSLRWASAESAGGGIPSNFKLGDPAPSVYSHPQCQRRCDSIYRQPLANPVVVWTANALADPSSQGSSPPSYTGFDHIWTAFTCFDSYTMVHMSMSDLMIGP